MLAFAKVEVDDGFAARIGQHLKATDAIDPHVLRKVLAVWRYGDVAELRLVHEGTDGGRFERAAHCLVRMSHQAQSNNEHRTQRLAPRHTFPSTTDGGAMLAQGLATTASVDA